jgi:hypothetical protein
MRHSFSAALGIATLVLLNGIASPAAAAATAVTYSDFSTACWLVASGLNDGLTWRFTVTFASQCLGISAGTTECQGSSSSGSVSGGFPNFSCFAGTLSITGTAQPEGATPTVFTLTGPQVTFVPAGINAAYGWTTTVTWVA